MALIIKNSAGFVLDQAGIELPATVATAFAVGDALQRDTANLYLERAVAAAAPSDADTGLFGISMSIKAAATALAKVVPFIVGMLLEVDLANNSSASHTLQRMVLTDHDTVNNNGTDSTANEGVFLQVAPIGAAADKKALVMFVGSQGQVNA